MPALKSTDHTCRIVWLGTVRDRKTAEVETDASETLHLDWDGPLDAPHSGRFRPSDSRVLSQHSKGTPIANVRQVSIVSQEEIDEIASDLGLDSFDPRWLGANIVVSGLADFSHIPPSARLQSENKTTLIVDMQNQPCHQIGMTIERDEPGKGKAFKDKAKGKRGVTAWIERPGQLALGDVLRLHIPSQRAWRGTES